MSVKTSKKKTISEKERIAWADSFKTSKRWLAEVKVDKTGSKHTQTEYARTLYAFCQWIGKNPDQLIAERKAEMKNPETERNAEHKVKEFCSILETDRLIDLETVKKLSKSTTSKITASLISFYRYSDQPLKMKVPKHLSRERQPHTVEELKTLMQIGDVRERAVIMVLKDSGMSREDVVTLTYGNIKNEYENGKDFIHLHVIREKEQIEYDTFLGKNAVEYLKAYLDYRQRKGEQLTAKSPLLATIQGTSLSPQGLSMIFDRLSDQVGFKTSPHRLRKYFESYMGLAAPSLLVKNWMGHSLGVEKSYFIPPVEKQKEKYIEGYKEIDLFKTEMNEAEIRKQNLLDSLRFRKDVTQEQLKAIENILAKITTMKEYDDAEQGIRNVLSMVREKKKSENNDCQKIIEEKDLETHIQNGWKFVATLPSGKIVVTNE